MASGGAEGPADGEEETAFAVGADAFGGAGLGSEEERGGADGGRENEAEIHGADYLPK